MWFNLNLLLYLLIDNIRFSTSERRERIIQRKETRSTVRENDGTKFVDLLFNPSVLYCTVYLLYYLPSLWFFFFFYFVFVTYNKVKCTWMYMHTNNTIKYFCFKNKTNFFYTQLIQILSKKFLFLTCK